MKVNWANVGLALSLVYNQEARDNSQSTAISY